MTPRDSMSTLEIRRYDPEDAKRVWEIHERALRASPVEFVEDAAADDDLDRISEEYLDTGGEFLVGLIDEEIVAVGGFKRHNENTAELRRMRVHPDHQRQGYGGRLLDELEARLRERGFDRVSLETNSRLLAAQRLYETHGLEEIHRETDSELGEEFITYQKQI